MIVDWESFPVLKTATEKLAESVSRYECILNNVPEDNIEARAYLAILKDTYDPDEVDVDEVDVLPLQHAYDKVQEEYKAKHPPKTNLTQKGSNLPNGRKDSKTQEYKHVNGTNSTNMGSIYSRSSLNNKAGTSYTKDSRGTTRYTISDRTKTQLSNNRDKAVQSDTRRYRSTSV